MVPPKAADGGSARLRRHRLLERRRASLALDRMLGDDVPAALPSALGLTSEGIKREAERLRAAGWADWEIRAVLAPPCAERAS